MTVCEILGLHNLVRARQFPDYPKAVRFGNAEMERTNYQDGLACVRCDHFEPRSGSPSHPPTTTRDARM